MKENGKLQSIGLKSLKKNAILNKHSSETRNSFNSWHIDI